MFVRFRQTKTRLQASLVHTRRVDGKVRQEHVAMLGTITVDVPPSVAERFAFWQRLHERLARLGNRLDAAAQAKVLGDIHAQIPMVTPDEVRALQLANAQADVRLWTGIADMHEGTAAGHKGLIAKTEQAKATAAAERAKATEHAARAQDRIARIERSEDVAGGLGKPVTFEEMLLKAGMTKADIAHCAQVHEVSEAFGFDTMMKAILKAHDRAERAELRAMHRRAGRQGRAADASGAAPPPDSGKAINRTSEPR